MAVTGYFIDEDWNYREILLGFEPLHGTHTGVNLSSVLLDLLRKSMCTSRFDIESEQLTFVDEYLTAQEIQAAREEQDACKAVDEFNPISDNKEDAPAAISPPIQPPSERALGKRPRTEAIEDQGPLIELDNKDYQDEIPLPDNSDLHGKSSI